MSRPLSPRMRRQFEAAGCTFRMYDSGDGFPMEIGYSRDGGYIAPTVYGGDHYRRLARLGIFDPQSSPVSPAACAKERSETVENART